VGGLVTAVDNGVSGLLVDGHDSAAWAQALGSVVDDPQRRAALSRGALGHAASFGWDRTAAGVLDVYRQALGAGPSLPGYAAAGSR
jgi:D-inositol-3-phosphate glycosyltransferase